MLNLCTSIVTRLRSDAKLLTRNLHTLVLTVWLTCLSPA